MITRRQFIRRSAVIGTAAWLGREAGLVTEVMAAENDRGLPRVVHGRHGRAVLWSEVSGLYRDWVDQDAVSSILNASVRRLKGGTLDEAWQSVFPLANPESRILAIKVSCNNSNDSVNGAGNEIDAVPEPAIAVVEGFIRAGGLEQNVHIYDGSDEYPIRYIASWFREKVVARFPQVMFHDDAFSNGGYPAGPYHPSTHVTWSAGYESPPPEMSIYQLVLDADYLVNIPIVKPHGFANVSLGFKNHFGTVNRCARLHPYLQEDVPQASVLADIMASPRDPTNPNVRSIAEKTVLTVADMLYASACTHFNTIPDPWITFGGEWPAALVVSDDPVALDSVLIDLIEAEPRHGSGDCAQIKSYVRTYLRHAEGLGLGAHDQVDLPVGELHDPSRMNYQKIDYHYLELFRGGAELMLSRNLDGSIQLSWDHYFDGSFEVYRAGNADFSDQSLLAVTSEKTYTDRSAPDRAYYRVVYSG